MTDTDVALSFLQAFHDQDRTRAEELLADDVTFTSPQDDHLDRATYLEVCFPTADHFASHRLLATAESPAGVFLLYEYALHDGTLWRNAEVLTVRAGRVAEIQVFFGGKQPSTG